MTRVFDINTSNDRGLVLFSSVFFWNLKPTRGFYRPDDDCPEYGASAYLDRESPICPDLLKSTHHLLVQNLLISAQLAARNTAGLLMVLAINLRLLFLRPTDGRTGSDTVPGHLNTFLFLSRSSLSLFASVIHIHRSAQVFTEHFSGGGCSRAQRWRRAGEEVPRSPSSSKSVSPRTASSSTPST